MVIGSASVNELARLLEPMFDFRDEFPQIDSQRAIDEVAQLVQRLVQELDRALGRADLQLVKPGSHLNQPLQEATFLRQLVNPTRLPGFVRRDSLRATYSHVDKEPVGSYEPGR